MVIRLKDMKALSRAPTVASRCPRAMLMSVYEYQMSCHYVQATQQTLASLPRRKLMMQL